MKKFSIFKMVSGNAGRPKNLALAFLDSNAKRSRRDIPQVDTPYAENQNNKHQPNRGNTK